MNTDYITASELGDYVYCKRGWWLRRHGKLATNPSMMHGTRQHSSIFSSLSMLKVKKLFAIGLIIIGVLVSLYLLI